tara:strand:- start:142 stop:795 length:654 start_codon:yes stop_codon:yes gene_type:complete
MAFTRVTRTVLTVLLIGIVPPATLAGEASTLLAQPGESVATFAGGCFWCVESDFDHVLGVVRTVSGYTGGDTDNPSYKDVTKGGTGHREAVQVIYDPEQTDFSTLVEVFWRSVDPTDADGQFCDRGQSYQTSIFAHDDEQRAVAETSKAALEASGVLGQPVVTPIEDAAPFFAAEEYHQNYYEQNPVRYKFYRFSCGRDGRIKELWGDEAHTGIEKN